MRDDTVVYNGRAILERHFRVFVFNENGEKKLMNSYPEYEEHINSGIWFKTKELADKAKVKRKKKGDE